MYFCIGESAKILNKLLKKDIENHYQLWYCFVVKFLYLNLINNLHKIFILRRKDKEVLRALFSYITFK
ncbi:conserved protein of unknown function [Clostridium beijerinckii]|nr:conserved protein of unknown function [Clostridium beijerinckii]